MTVELKLLAFGAALGLVQIVLAAHAASRQRGYLWTAGSRDEPVPPLTGLAGRLERALRNFLETFPLFAAALIACVMVGKTGPQTLYGAVLYVVARALYVPLYASGVSVVRTLVWTVSVVGILMIVVAFFR